MSFTPTSASSGSSSRAHSAIFTCCSSTAAALRARSSIVTGRSAPRRATIAAASAGPAIPSAGRMRPSPTESSRARHAHPTSPTGTNGHTYRTRFHRNVWYEHVTIADTPSASASPAVHFARRPASASATTPRHITGASPRGTSPSVHSPPSSTSNTSTRACSPTCASSRPASK
ncbi:MAG: hypothetical protein R3F14_25435 [Polyangiaceae bacterium]